MQIPLLLSVRVEPVDQHANDAQDKRRRRQSVGFVSRISQPADNRGKEVVHGGRDIDGSQQRHEQPHLGICQSEHQTFAAAGLLRVVLLAEVGFKVPCDPRFLSRSKPAKLLDRVGQDECKHDCQEDRDGTLDQKELVATSQV